MKKVILGVFVVMATIGAFSVVSVSDSQAIESYGGPCSTAEMYNYNNPHWNAMCFQFMIDYDCIMMIGEPCN